MSWVKWKHVLANKVNWRACIIKSIHGQQAAFAVNDRLTTKGAWSSIVGSILKLHAKRIIPLSTLALSIRDGGGGEYYVLEGSMGWKCSFDRVIS